MKKKTKRSKNQKAYVKIPFPTVLAGVLVLAGVFGLSYVWLCAHCDQLGQEIRRLEQVQRDTRRRLINEQDRWSNLLAPANFERALQRHNLAMSLPDERQIVRVRSGRISEEMKLAYNK